MHKFFLAASLVLLLAGRSGATNIVYTMENYSDYQDGYTLTGTITTDGTIGDLTGHILSWEWTATDGTTTRKADSTFATASISTVAVSATADGKILVSRDRSSGAGYNELVLNAREEGTDRILALSWRSGILVFAGNTFPQGDFYGFPGTRIDPLPGPWAAGGGILPLSLPGTTGSIVVASIPSVSTNAVPEPSTIASLGLAGLIGVGYRCRRRKA